MDLGDAAWDGSASFVLIVVLTGCGGSFELLANRRVKKVVPSRLGIALSFSACAPDLIGMRPLVGVTLLKMLSWACAERRVAAVTARIKNLQRLLQTSRIIRLSSFLGLSQSHGTGRALYKIPLKPSFCWKAMTKRTFRWSEQEKILFVAVLMHLTRNLV